MGSQLRGGGLGQKVTEKGKDPSPIRGFHSFPFIFAPCTSESLCVAGEMPTSVLQEGLQDLPRRVNLPPRTFPSPSHCPQVCALHHGEIPELASWSLLC